MRILLIEDEEHMAEAVAQILTCENYTVDVSFDGRSGYDCVLSRVYDLIILDIMLPGMDGLTVLSKIREEGLTTPVLLLSAKGSTKDKVIGLNKGADDYLAKPFDKEELLARVRALLRRKGELIKENNLQYGNIILNHDKLLMGNGHSDVNLTKREADLMEFLIMRKTLLTSKDLLIEKVWGYDSEADYNNVEVYISFLRKKLVYLTADIAIKTIRGTGYCLEQCHVQ